MARGRAAVPLLVDSLSETNGTVRGSAIRALGRIHARPEDSLPALTPNLKSRDYLTRAETLHAMAAFGTNGAKWMPTAEIVRCLADPIGFVGEWATNALRLVDPAEAAKHGIRLR